MFGLISKMVNKLSKEIDKVRTEVPDLYDEQSGIRYNSKAKSIEMPLTLQTGMVSPKNGYEKTGEHTVVASIPLYPHNESNAPYTLSERWLDVREPRFYGYYQKSNNGQYILGWNSEGYLLIVNNSVVFHRKMKEPQDGKLAENGTFILLTYGKSRSGVFHAVDATGQQLIRRALKAYPLNNGLSDDGRIAVCQTCNNDENNDGGKLFIFDLFEKKLISSL